MGLRWALIDQCRMTHTHTHTLAEFIFSLICQFLCDSLLLSPFFIQSIFLFHLYRALSLKHKIAHGSRGTWITLQYTYCTNTHTWPSNTLFHLFTRGLYSCCSFYVFFLFCFCFVYPFRWIDNGCAEWLWKKSNKPFIYKYLLRDLSFWTYSKRLHLLT